MSVNPTHASTENVKIYWMDTNVNVKMVITELTVKQVSKSKYPANTRRSIDSILGQDGGQTLV